MEPPHGGASGLDFRAGAIWLILIQIPRVVGMQDLGYAGEIELGQTHLRSL